MSPALRLGLAGRPGVQRLGFCSSIHRHGNLNLMWAASKPGPGLSEFPVRAGPVPAPAARRRRGKEVSSDSNHGYRDHRDWHDRDCPLTDSVRADSDTQAGRGPGIRSDEGRRL